MRCALQRLQGLRHGDGVLDHVGKQEHSERGDNLHVESVSSCVHLILLRQGSQHLHLLAAVQGTSKTQTLETVCAWHVHHACDSIM